MGALNVKINILNLVILKIQCCNLNNLGANEYNFEHVTNRNSVLEKINKKASQDQNDKEKIKHQSTKANINLNYDKEKVLVLVLEMETENHEIQDKLIITKTGLIDSLRRKIESSDDNAVYFG